MVKNTMLVMGMILAVACNAPGKKDAGVDTVPVQQIDTTRVDTPAHTNSLIISPGEGIGELTLGDETSVLNDKLGRPDLSDAAMGKSWSTWLAKKRDEHNNLPELNVFTTYKDSSMKEKTVQLIRTSSPDFKTVEGIRVYHALTDIKKAFPKVKERGRFKDESSGRMISVFDAKESGISFEIALVGDQEICVGIIVHPRNKDVMGNYQGLLFGKGWVMAGAR